MNRWITQLAAVAVGLSLTTAAYAAPEAGAAPKKPGQKGAKGQKAGGGKRMEMALAKLNLTPDQKTKIDKLIADSKAEGKKLRTAEGTPEEKKAKRREAGKAFRQKLNAILTPAQQAQLKEARPKRPATARKPKTAGAKPGKA